MGIDLDSALALLTFSSIYPLPLRILSFAFWGTGYKSNGGEGKGGSVCWGKTERDGRCFLTSGNPGRRNRFAHHGMPSGVIGLLLFCSRGPILGPRCAGRSQVRLSGKKPSACTQRKASLGDKTPSWALESPWSNWLDIGMATKWGAVIGEHRGVGAPLA